MKHRLGKGHLSVLIVLTLIDLICTIIWFEGYGVHELNPILSGPIEKSALKFSLIKMALTIPSVLIIRAHISNTFAQVGGWLLLFSYAFVCFIHIKVFCHLFYGL